MFSGMYRKALREFDFAAGILIWKRKLMLKDRRSVHCWIDTHVWFMCQADKRTHVVVHAHDL